MILMWILHVQFKWKIKSSEATPNNLAMVWTATTQYNVTIMMNTPTQTWHQIFEAHICINIHIDMNEMICLVYFSLCYDYFWCAVCFHKFCVYLCDVNYDFSYIIFFCNLMSTVLMFLLCSYVCDAHCVLFAIFCWIKIYCFLFCVLCILLICEIWFYFYVLCALLCSFIFSIFFHVYYVLFVSDMFCEVCYTVWWTLYCQLCRIFVCVLSYVVCSLHFVLST